jgi:hypothetical protein
LKCKTGNFTIQLTRNLIEMEYADKDEQSEKYISQRLREVARLPISDEEKNKIYELGHSITYACYEIINGEQSVLNSYLVDALDTILGFYQKKDEEETFMAGEIIFYSKKISEMVLQIDILLKELEDRRQTLEKKVTSKEIIKEMKRVN